MSIPPGIITQSVSLPNGKIYAFSHRQLGELGRLIITDAGAGRAQVSAEVAHGDLSDPLYLQRLNLFSQVAQACLEALPGPHPPLPSLEEARARVALYQRFLVVSDTEGMERFARRLSQGDATLLLALIADNASAALQAREIDDLYGIVQREQDLRHFLQRKG